MEAQKTEQMVGISFSQLKELLAEARKPPVDPIKEAQKKREQETKDANLKAMWARKAEKRRVCAHSRQDGTCVIAWAQQSDNEWRGYCPNCDNVFAPGDPDYLEQRRRPRGLQESVRVVA